MKTKAPATRRRITCRQKRVCQRAALTGTGEWWEWLRGMAKGQGKAGVDAHAGRRLINPESAYIETMAPTEGCEAIVDPGARSVPERHRRPHHPNPCLELQPAVGGARDGASTAIPQDRIHRRGRMGPRLGISGAARLSEGYNALEFGVRAQRD